MKLSNLYATLHIVAIFILKNSVIAGHNKDQNLDVIANKELEIPLKGDIYDHELPHGVGLEHGVTTPRRKRHGKYKDVKRSKLRKKDGRRKIAVSAVEKIVEEKLQEALQPLTTALSLIRMGIFTEGLVRQLSSLELIQSKLLTEFGQLRAAVNEVGRHTLDLGRQVAGLDERLAVIDRQIPHRMDIRNDYTLDNIIGTSSGGGKRNNHHSTSTGNLQTIEWIKDAIVVMTTKLSTYERRVQTELEKIENKTKNEIRKGVEKLEGKMENLAHIGMEKLMNNSMCSASDVSTFSFPSFSSSFSSSSLRRGVKNTQDPLHRKEKFPSIAKVDPTTFEKSKSSRNKNPRNHFVYLPPDGLWKNSNRSKKDVQSGVQDTEPKSDKKTSNTKQDDEYSIPMVQNQKP